MEKLKTKMRFPQIVWEEKEVELSEEELLIWLNDGAAPLIWHKMTEQEKQHTLGYKMVDQLTKIDMEFLTLTKEQEELINELEEL